MYWNKNNIPISKQRIGEHTEAETNSLGYISKSKLHVWHLGALDRLTVDLNALGSHTYQHIFPCIGPFFIFATVHQGWLWHLQHSEVSICSSLLPQWYHFQNHTFVVAALVIVLLGAVYYLAKELEKQRLIWAYSIRRVLSIMVEIW